MKELKFKPDGPKGHGQRGFESKVSGISAPPSTQPGSEAPTTIERKGGDTVDVWHMEEAQ